jgi:hypothetical protein
MSLAARRTVRVYFLDRFIVQRFKWLPDLDSNQDEPVNSRVACQLADRERCRSSTNRQAHRRCAGAAGRAGHDGGAPRNRTELNLLAKHARGPSACPHISKDSARRWIRTTDAHAFNVPLYATELPGQRGMVRTSGIEPLSPEWHSRAQPIYQARLMMVRRDRVEPPQV